VYRKKIVPLRRFSENSKVGKFGAYQVDFRNVKLAEVQTFEYLLDNRFFMDIEGDEVQKGKVKVTMTLERKPTFFLLQFHLNGTVVVSCDRCLDDMDFDVEADNRLIVKLGKEYSEESDEILVIAEEESSLNLAWFLYEFVALAVPMKHIHAPGKCNKSMTAKLKKHRAKDVDDVSSEYEDNEGNTLAPDEESESQAIDPRWDALKAFKTENEI